MKYRDVVLGLIGAIGIYFIGYGIYRDCIPIVPDLQYNAKVQVVKGLFKNCTGLVRKFYYNNHYDVHLKYCPLDEHIYSTETFERSYLKRK